ncbi:MAG: heme ABC transporter ATP-binding protein [Pseudomonadota bacterium]
MLTTTGLSAALGGKPVLRDIGFAARPGQVTAIVGPNGSGKTTLLRALTGDLRYAGSAVLNGVEVAGAKPVALAAIRAVLSQSTQLAFPFTVLEVVRLGLLSGVQTAAHAANLPQQALSEVGLDGYAGRNFQELSGGEQARVHLARVLVQVWHPVGPAGPRWLFLDEPVASLDIGHQLQVMRLARRFADAGGGVVAVMHDLNLTAMFAAHVALLSQGRLAAQGRPEDVLTDARLSAAYGCRLRVNTAPVQGQWILPQAAMA